ncbi:MAG: winged helix-turn-helix transcriptional regulator [Candidatus Thermoplasmatota archaeon]|nr:winged helix-turn-helix transcriptional regulator [Candidatus Thermoplasmatota archaeon]
MASRFRCVVGFALLLFSVLAIPLEATAQDDSSDVIWTEPRILHQVSQEIESVSISRHTNGTLVIVWYEQADGIMELRAVMLDDSGAPITDIWNITDHSWMVPLELEYQNSTELYQLPIRPYYPSSHIGRDGSLYIAFKHVVEYRPYLDPSIPVGHFIRLLKLDGAGNVTLDRIIYKQPSNSRDFMGPHFILDSEDNLHLAWREERRYEMDGWNVSLREVMYMKLDGGGNVLVQPTVVSDCEGLSNFTYRYEVERPVFGMFVDESVHVSYHVYESTWEFGPTGGLRVTHTRNVTTHYTRFTATAEGIWYTVEPTDMGPDVPYQHVARDSVGRTHLIGSRLEVFDEDLDAVFSVALPLDPSWGPVTTLIDSEDMVHVAGGMSGRYATVDRTGQIVVETRLPVGRGPHQTPSAEGYWDSRSIDMVLDADGMPVVAASERRGYGPDRESRLVVTRLVHTPEEAIEPVLICGLPLGALALASALFVTLTEVGRYGFLSLLVPLYVRLTRSQVLDHFVRGQIYEYIKLNPGDHYSSIRRELSLSNGLLAYHLSVLEKQNFVKSQRDGKLKRFYPVDMTIPRKKGVRLSDLQVKMLRRIDKNPSITQGQLAGLLGVSRQTVNHNIKLMERAGVLESEKDGGSLTYRVKSV